MEKDSLETLRQAVSKFAKDRDWEQFHSPKNLSMALAAESGELLEIFQWLTEEQSRALEPKALTNAEEEIADILIYLVRLAERLDIDPIQAAKKKLEINASKYPVNLAKGSAQKYDELDQ